MTEGIIYVATNPSMPGLIKIGMTTNEDVASRLYSLYSTGVPEPFVCEYAGKVVGVKSVEKALHKAFKPYRIHSGREFFRIEPEQPIAILKVIALEDKTPEVEQNLANLMKSIEESDSTDPGHYSFGA